MAGTKVDVNAQFEAQMEKTEPRESGPSYKALAFSRAMLLARAGYTTDQIEVISTKTGTSALIEILKGEGWHEKLPVRNSNGNGEASNNGS